MKTHSIAKSLSELANALRKAPNQTLEELVSVRVKRTKPDPKGIPVALSALVALSDFDKAQWLGFLREHNFPIEVRPRDASRDILGKLLKYLEKNPEARKRLASSAEKSRSETSPELMRALDLLLKS